MTDYFGTLGQKLGSDGKNSPFVKLGDDAAKGQVKHCRGVLLDVRESTKFPGQMLYDMRGEGGALFTLVGSHAINEKLKSEYVGDAFDITYEGMSTTKSKKTVKNFTILRIPVALIPADMAQSFAEVPAALASGADDLPF